MIELKKEVMPKVSATNASRRKTLIKLSVINLEISYMNVQIVGKRRSRPSSPRRALICLEKSARYV